MDLLLFYGNILETMLKKPVHVTLSSLVFTAKPWRFFLSAFGGARGRRREKGITLVVKPAVTIIRYLKFYNLLSSSLKILPALQSKFC